MSRIPSVVLSVLLCVLTAMAVEAGLTFRPLADTVRDTLEVAETVEGVGLAREREAELLAAAS